MADQISETQTAVGVSSQHSTQKTQKRHTEAPAHRKRAVDKAQPTHTVALKCRRLRQHRYCHRQRVGSNTERTGPSSITEAWVATQSKDTHNKRGRLARETYRAHDSRLPMEEVISRWARRAVRRRVAAEVLKLFYSHSIRQRQRPSSPIITKQQGGTVARTQEPPDSVRPNRSVSFRQRGNTGKNTLTERYVHGEPQTTTHKRRENNRGPWSGPGQTRRTQVTRSTQTRAGARKRTSNTLQRHDASSLRKKHKQQGDARVAVSEDRAPHGSWSPLPPTSSKAVTASKQPHQRQPGWGRPPMTRWRNK